MIYLLEDEEDLVRVLTALQTKFVLTPVTWTSINDPTFKGTCNLVYRLAESRMTMAAGTIDRAGMRECRLLADVPSDKLDAAAVSHMAAHVCLNYPVLVQLDDVGDMPVESACRNELSITFQRLDQTRVLGVDTLNWRMWRAYGNRTVEDLMGLLKYHTEARCVLIEHVSEYRPSSTGACIMPPHRKERAEVTAEEALRLVTSEADVFRKAMDEPLQAHTYICTESGRDRTYKAAWNSPSKGVWCTLTVFKEKEKDNG